MYFEEEITIQEILEILIEIYEFIFKQNSTDLMEDIMDITKEISLKETYKKFIGDTDTLDSAVRGKK